LIFKLVNKFSIKIFTPIFASSILFPVHMSKEQVLFNALLQSATPEGVILTMAQRTALLVHAVMIGNGFVPTGVSGHSGRMVCFIPNWSQDQNDVFKFLYVDNVEVKCVVLGDQSPRLAVHASTGVEIYSVTVEIPMEMGESEITKIVRLVKGNILPGLDVGRGSVPSTDQRTRSQHPRVSEEERRVFLMPPERPRAPPYGTPMGPGELVGPEHPIFTGESQTGEGRQRGLLDPRYDPIGPGYLGEPDADHFPPPPFGEPPGGRRPPGRTPLRGPHANLGPGGMFM